MFFGTQIAQIGVLVFGPLDVLEMLQTLETQKLTFECQFLQFFKSKIAPPLKKNIFRPF